MQQRDFDIAKVLREFAHLPRFSDGRINYSSSDKAPVLICFVKFGDKILLLKRSDKVYAYRGKWSTLAGFIDEPKELFEKALEELEEELGILRENIASYHVGMPYEYVDQTAKKTWIRYPMIVELKAKPKIKLNWEHTAYEWIAPNDVSRYDVAPGFEETLKMALQGNLQRKTI